MIQKTFNVRLTGTTGLIMHADDINWRDNMEAWNNDPENARLSKAGDDRTPAWRWLGSVYHDANYVGIPRSYRFKTVTEAWRNELLRDHNIEIGVDPGIAFVALTPSQRVKSGSKKVEIGIRGVTRGGKRLHLIDDSRLTDDDRNVKAHRMMIAGRIQQAINLDNQRFKLPPLPESITRENR